MLNIGSSLDIYLSTCDLNVFIVLLIVSIFDLATSIKSPSFLIARPFASSPDKKFKAKGNTLITVFNILSIGSKNLKSSLILSIHPLIFSVF